MILPSTTSRSYQVPTLARALSTSANPSRSSGKRPTSTLVRTGLDFTEYVPPLRFHFRFLLNVDTFDRLELISQPWLPRPRRWACGSLYTTRSGTVMFRWAWSAPLLNHRRLNMAPSPSRVTPCLGLSAATRCVLFHLAVPFNPDCGVFYQIRYHHDGKYNVMSLDGPLEIYGEYSHYRHGTTLI